MGYFPGQRHVRAILLPCLVGAATLAPLQDACAATINFGDYSFGAGDGANIGAIPVTAPLGFIGFSFDYFEPIPDPSWASNLLVMVTAPDLSTFTAGGVTSPSDTQWSFAGPGSDGPGHYGQTFTLFQFPAGFGLASGDYEITLLNDWIDPTESGTDSDPNPNRYNQFTVSWGDAVSVPEPESLAPAWVGLALGLLGLARRRRSGGRRVIPVTPSAREGRLR